MVDGGSAQSVESADDAGVAFSPGGEGFAQSGPTAIVSGAALVGVDPVVGGAEAIEGCALRPEVQHRA